MTAPLMRVLVVDDNQDSADILGALLKMLDLDVQVAYDGKSALAMFDTFQPAVMFIDLGMPGIDGYEVAARIRATGSDAKLVALTGWGEDSVRRLTEQAGFDRHLVKPADVKSLREILGVEV
jgi:CheY-like chemotaxis protein